MTKAREVARFSPPRIAYHPAVQERFGVDQAGWRALIDAVMARREDCRCRRAGAVLLQSSQSRPDSSGQCI